MHIHIPIVYLYEREQFVSITYIICLKYFIWKAKRISCFQPFPFSIKFTSRSSGGGSGPTFSETQH